MGNEDDARALRWACQAWLKAGREEDRRVHAVDAARVAHRLGADAARVAEMSFVDLETATEILRIGDEDPGVLVEKMFLRWMADDEPGALDVLSEDVEIVSRDGETIVGLSALRARLDERPDGRPTIDVRLDLVDRRRGTVIVAGTLAPRAGESEGADEPERVAWVCEVVDGSVVRITTHEDWRRAQLAAG